jgi:hypothetical protein
VIIFIRPLMTTTVGVRSIVLQLKKMLTPNFVAAPNVFFGDRIEVEVATLEKDEPNQPDWGNNGGTLTATAPIKTQEPTFRGSTDLIELDEFEVHIYNSARGRRLVAAIELVSPRNKDRPEARQAFVSKCTALLQQNVCVTIMDLVTERRANLYAELLHFCRLTDRNLSDPPTPIYAVTLRRAEPQKKFNVEAWYHPLALGQPLPTLPIWLSDELSISFDWETNYEETCAALSIT